MSKSNFIGPAPLSQVRLFNAHPTGAMNKAERLETIMGDGGIGELRKLTKLCSSMSKRNSIDNFNCSS